MNWRKNDGSITLFVIVAMLAFVFFTLATYTLISRRNQIQTDVTSEIKNKYDEGSDKSEYEKYFENDAIPIYSINELKYVGSGKNVSIDKENGKIYTFAPNATYVLKNDINLNVGKYVIENEEIIFNENASVWSPIGTEVTPFSGLFEGMGYTISGLYIKDITEGNQGLFGVINDAIISNVNVSGRIISSSNYVGGIVGKVKGNDYKINNCSADIQIEGINYVGGIAGGIEENISGNITNCCNKGKISGVQYVGGIVGDLNKATIKMCYNIGNLTGNSKLGGIAGNNEGLISNCYNLGTLTANVEEVGGIVGIQNLNDNNIKIEKCYNVGQVSNVTNSGSIVGYSNCIISKCFKEKSLFPSETDENIKSHSAEYMKSSLFVNNELGEDSWKIIRAGDYPILYWEKGEAINVKYKMEKADGSWNGSFNVPKLADTGLIPVYNNGTAWVDLTNTSSEEEWDKWYNYADTSASGATADSSRWANARSKDGSMWVWIPRYEYKIDSVNKKIDVKFIPVTTKSGETGYTTDENGITTSSNSYIIHPAFTNSVNNGGWESEISGFWVAKYVAGYQYGENDTPSNENLPNDDKIKKSNLSYTSVNSTYSNNFFGGVVANTTKISYPVFKANVFAYNLISVGDMYNLAKEIDGNGNTQSVAYDMYGLKNIDSHLEKNSEWGAVAYLSYSQYGTNKSQNTMNKKNLNNAIYMKNAASGTLANIYAVTGWGNSAEGDITASSNKNITGVFDMRGNVWEYTANIINGANTNPHYSILETETTEGNNRKSTKYITYSTDNNKKGDATVETLGWNSNASTFGDNSNPIFIRGGNYANQENNTGIFAFDANNGGPDIGCGFRVCLVP